MIVVEITEKRCSRCLEMKSAKAFYKDKDVEGKLSSVCRACNNAKMRAPEYLDRLNKQRRNLPSNSPYKAKARETQKARRKTEKGKHGIRVMNLKKFGLTPEQYDQLFLTQNGVCAACSQPETATNQYGVMRLAVDHCHTNGKIRGLLCMICNRVLGMVNESPKHLNAMAQYI